MFDADGEAHEIFGYACSLQLLGRELAVRGGSGMENAAARVGDMRFLRDELKRFHKFRRLLYVALNAEAEHAARAVGQIFLRERMVFVIGQGGVQHPVDLRVFGKVCRRLCRIGGMPLHAKRERIAAQPAQKGVLRAHDGAQIAHHLRAALGRELRGGEIGVYQTVVAFVRFVEGGVALVPLEIEVAAVHDDAAERRRVPVEIFRRGMHDDVHAPIEGLAQHGGRERIVVRIHDAVLLGDVRDLFKINDFNGRVGDRFGENQLGFIVDEFFNVLGGIVGVEKAGLNAELGQGDGKEVEAAAVDRRGRDDVIAGAAQRERHEQDRGHSRRAADRRNAPFQRRDLALERRNGGVCKAGIKIAVRLQIE